MNTQSDSPVVKAIKILGGEECKEGYRGGLTKLANACDVTPQAVNKWLKSKAPADRCIQIEEATGGQVTRYELRPDVFGDTPRAAA